MSVFIVVQYLDEGFEMLGAFMTQEEAIDSVKMLIEHVDGSSDLTQDYNFFWIKSDKYRNGPTLEYGCCKLGIKSCPLSQLNLSHVLKPKRD